ncbi:MAG: urate hydroxylase PuuD [Pseudomonadota bacterium]
MLPYLLDWLDLLLRWAHIITGITWIGTSFYFIALDLSLRQRAKMDKGVYGTAWEVHGGGFYHVEKYTVAPDDLPDDLIWHKWQAYLTWMTGFSLLVLIYYIDANLYLIDASKWDATPLEAGAFGAGSLAVGWLIYTGICRSPIGRYPTVTAVCVFALILTAAYIYTAMFTGRGAFIHVGAFVGTIMAANVFMIIIPNQKKITASLLAGETPDPEFGRVGKLRSTHNNYLTLPVLLMMVSGHYPFLYSHPHSWMIVGFIIVAGAMIRHFINRHDAGDPLTKISWTLPVGATALFLAAVITAPEEIDASVAVISDAQALTLVQTHCSTCHAQNPSHEWFEEAPAGFHLETVNDLRLYSQQIMEQAVLSDAMPLGNETDMTDAERQSLGAWITSLE